MARGSKLSVMTGFHHVAYACRDLEATTAFYETLGFPLVHTEVSGSPAHCQHIQTRRYGDVPLP